jgi:hypothetical protein
VPARRRGRSIGTPGATTDDDPCNGSRRRETGTERPDLFMQILHKSVLIPDLGSR